MKDFLLLIKTEGSVWTDLSPEALKEHMDNGMAYISGLMEAGTLKNANPIQTSGRIISEQDGVMKDGPYNESKEVLAGYFHIVAENLDEASKIAKANPIFKDIPTTIEVYTMMPIGG